jgi:hypothetical protein
MNNRTIDVDAAVEIAVSHARARIVEQAEQIVFDRGGNFDDEVAAMVADKQPALATYANTVRSWILGGAKNGPLRFNSDGSAKQ